jgi:hypothetical protein
MYRSYTRWLFDGSETSPIPEEQEILKYNSPITIQYMLQSFLPNSKMTIYMNKHFNNFHLYSLDKKQFLQYIKHLVLKLNLTRGDFNYKPKRDDEGVHLLQKKLMGKIPELKPYDIALLCEQIDNLEDGEKEKYYAGLDMIDPKKRKMPKKKKKKNEKLSLEGFVNMIFNYD